MIYIALGISALLVLADQLIKLWALESLAPISQIPLIHNVLYLKYTENTGAAFGILKNATVLLSIITAVILLGLIVLILLKKIKNPTIIWAMSLVIAGGIGNLIDRVFRGFVVDYIYFSPINFPVFNFADICVVCGTILLIFYLVFIEPRKATLHELHEQDAEEESMNSPFSDEDSDSDRL